MSQANALSDEQFEDGLANRTLSDLTAAVTPVSGDALLFIGSMRDFERRGYLAGTPAHFMATMTEDMRIALRADLERPRQ